MQNKNKLAVKPTLVLTIITTIIAALLIVTSISLKSDESVLSEEMLEKCVLLMGKGEYHIVSDWIEEGYKIKKPEKIQKLIFKDDGTVAFQLTADGYAKDGLNMLVAMNADGSIKGISIISMGETPGLGTKVDNSSFLFNFIGADNPVSIVKSAPQNSNEIQAVTGATYSSRGVAKGINLAINTFKELGV